MEQTCQIYLLSLELTKSNCTHSKQTLPVAFMGLLKFFTKWDTSNLSAELLNSNTSAATSTCYGHVLYPPTRGHAFGPAVSTSNHISCGFIYKYAHMCTYIHLYLMNTYVFQCVYVSMLHKIIYSYLCLNVI